MFFDQAIPSGLGVLERFIGLAWFLVLRLRHPQTVVSRGQRALIMRNLWQFRDQGALNGDGFQISRLRLVELAARSVHLGQYEQAAPKIVLSSGHAGMLSRQFALNRQRLLADVFRFLGF